MLISLFLTVIVDGNETKSNLRKKQTQVKLTTIRQVKQKKKMSNQLNQIKKKKIHFEQVLNQCGSK